MGEKIHALIVLVRASRHIVAIMVILRALIVVLMLLGVRVATIKLEFPEELSLNDKVIHIFVFFAFSVLMDVAIKSHSFWLWKGLPLLAYGVAIEVFQYFSPDRSFSLLDMGADFLGILLYFTVKKVLVWVDSRSFSNGNY